MKGLIYSEPAHTGLFANFSPLCGVPMETGERLKGNEPGINTQIESGRIFSNFSPFSERPNFMNLFKMHCIAKVVEFC